MKQFGSEPRLAVMSDGHRFRRAELTSAHSLALGLVLALSLCLNLVGNSWGTPERWHPDEMDAMAAGLVAQKSLNPHFFPYGALHYYTLAVTAAMPVGVYNFLFDRKPAASDERALAAWRDRKDTHIRILARATSAVMAMLTVLMTYLIGALLFSRATGLLAALFLAVSPYFVLISHFATVDTAANFWYWLACLLSVLSWKRPTRPGLAIAAFAVGLAAGAKLDRLLAVIPWTVAGLLQPDPLGSRLRRLLVCAALIPVGYVVANPTILFSFYEFVDGTVKDLAFNTLRESNENSFISMAYYTATGVGIPAFAISLASIAYLCVAAIRGDMRREFAWLLSALLPFYLVYGPRFSYPWYTILLYPALAIAGAQGCVRLARAVNPRAVVWVNLVVLAALTLSLLYSIAVDQEFVHDSRIAAATWIETQVPRGASIEIGRRGPILSDVTYDIRSRAIPQAYYENARTWRAHLGSSRLYETVHSTLLALQRRTGGLADTSSPGPAYKGWFDRVTEPPPAAKVASDPSDPDYRVVVDYLEGSELPALQAPGSHYRLAATFHYRHPLGLDMPFPFVNPTVYVFKRIAAPS